MRQTLKAAGLTSLLLLSLTDLQAEPLVKGFYIEKLPTNSSTQLLASGKGLVLAHVLNQSEEAISSGTYQIGVEVESNGNVKTYSLTPKGPITAGSLKTFRMAIPVSDINKSTGKFRVFSRINGNTTWSEKYSFQQGIKSSQSNSGTTTLYTEAPPVSPNNIALQEVPFETNTPKVTQTSAVTSAKTTEKEAKAVVKEQKADASQAIQKAEKLMAEEKAKATATTNKVVASAKAATNSASEKVENSSDKATENAKQIMNNAKQAAAEKAAKEAAKKKAEAEEKAKAELAAASDSKSSNTRKINPSEFKKLRTMDEELIIYVVKDGDTLRSIAENYYGNSSKERVIADLNFIEKSSSVRVGEEIIVEVRPLTKTSKNS